MTTIEGLLEAVFFVGSVSRLYSGTSDRLRSVQFEGQPVKRRLGGWCEMAASLGPSQLLLVEESSVRAAVKRGPECGKLKNLPQ
jgi:hypothetical protein